MRNVVSRVGDLCTIAIALTDFTGKSRSVCKLQASVARAMCKDLGRQPPGRLFWVDREINRTSSFIRLYGRSKPKVRESRRPS